MYVYIYYMHMFSTCIDFIPMCIYVYLCVYFVHVLTTVTSKGYCPAHNRRSISRAPWHHGTVQVYFEGRHLERLRPLRKGWTGPPLVGRFPSFGLVF